MDIREQKLKQIENTYEISDHQLNKMIASTLTNKITIIDNLYYKYMNLHIEHHTNESFTKYIHSPFIAVYGIVSIVTLFYTKNFKIMPLTANICAMAFMNQMIIERKSLKLNKDMADDYFSNKKNYDDLMQEKMKRINLWKLFTSGLTENNISLYLQYLPK